MSSAGKKFVAFGETMVRFGPMIKDHAPVVPGLPERVIASWQSVGGDEANVCVALQKLGVESEWISVMGDGTLSDYVMDVMEESGVKCAVNRLKGERVATFHMVPAEKRVEYHRAFSAFARHDPNLLNWDKLLPTPSGTGKGYDTWLHMTGITPMLGPNALTSWLRCMDLSLSRGIPVSMDLNHRPQLGTLDTLWKIMRPYASRLDVLILARSNLLALSRMENLNDVKDLAPTDPRWNKLLVDLRARLGVKWLACCFKTRDSNGVQTRWSTVASAEGLHTTSNTPIMHKPKEDVGGGSAWAAGLAHFVMHEGAANVELALRRADLLSSLCQESIGDHSHVTLDELMTAEAKWAGRTALVSGHEETEDKEEFNKIVSLMKESSVCAIIRAKNPDQALKRGIELAAMGCRCLEVTLDTPNVHEILKALIAKVPKTCVVGVGTCMDKSQVAAVAAAGGKFALSPICPEGFIEECLKYNIVPVPGAFTPQEVWDYYQTGAPIIKLFPASMWPVKVFKGLRGVGAFKDIAFMPSNGISPKTYVPWLEAGACAVGMGSALSGSDLKYPTGSPEFKLAVNDWKTTGRPAALKMFADVEKARRKSKL